MAPDYPAKGSGNHKKKPAGKNELARAIEEFSKTSFPERSENDRADQLHAELLLFDSAVGEAVMTVAQGKHVPKEDLRGNPELRQDLEQLAAGDDAVAAADAAKYLTYLDGLEHLLHIARAVTIHKKKR
ncbi:MAG TPA: hypothetical protein VHV83_20735 [Armatimonadota bacterium]|nr:hypothetical protein [Armatimonadota bacterium]